MSIPNLSNIRDFVESITVFEPDDDRRSWTIIPTRTTYDRGRATLDHPIKLFYRPNATFDLSAMLRRFSDELAKKGHVVNDTIVGLLLVLYATLRSEARKDAIADLNEMLQLIVVGRVSQFYIMPFPPPQGFESFGFGSFAISSGNSEGLHQLTRQAGSPNFYEENKSRIRGRVRIERRNVPCKVFPWGSGANLMLGRREHTLWDRARNQYFQEVSLVYFEQFWKSFDEEQQLQICLGAPSIAGRDVRYIQDPIVLSVYQWESGGGGFVAPIQQHMGFDFAKMHTRIPAVRASLRKEYGFETYADTRMDRSLRLFARYMSRGYVRNLENDFNDAFLSFVIALDLLFGEKDENVQSVCRRAAVLVHRALGLEFTGALTALKKIYDLRSGYVHGGRDVDKAQVESVFRICQHVIVSLLLFRKQMRGRSGDDPMAWWVKQIDLVASLIEAGRPVDDDLLERIGI